MTQTTTQSLARLVKPATIKSYDDGHKTAYFRLAINNKFFTASAYIKPGKTELEAFYASLEKGQLVSVEYVDNKGFLNIWSMFKRELKKDTKETVAA